MSIPSKQQNCKEWHVSNLFILAPRKQQRWVLWVECSCVDSDTVLVQLSDILHGSVVRPLSLIILTVGIAHMHQPTSHIHDTHHLHFPAFPSSHRPFFPSLSTTPLPPSNLFFPFHYCFFPRLPFTSFILPFPPIVLTFFSLFLLPFLILPLLSPLSSHSFPTWM